MGGWYTDDTHTQTHKIYTHISIDQNIKPNSIGFDQSAVVRPILHLIVFRKPAQTDKSHYFYIKEQHWIMDQCATEKSFFGVIEKNPITIMIICTSHLKA